MNSEPAWPNAGVDALTLGFRGRMPGFFVDPEASLYSALERLQEAGYLTTPRSQRSANYERLSFALMTDRDQPAGQLHIDIHVHRKGDDLVLGDRCAIRFNPMVLLRGELGPDACGGPGFGGAENVLGAGHLLADLASSQLRLLQDAVQYALDALETAFPGWIPGSLWLKQAEACRDMTVTNAVAAVRVVQHVTLSGSVTRKLDLYRREGSVEQDNGPTLRFINTASDPEAKIYPKRFDKVRLEIVCRSRRTFKGLGPQRQCPVTSDAAVALVLEFLRSAEPHLDRLEEHVRCSLAGEASIGSLMAALQPLLRRSFGESKGMGPTSARAQEIAKQVVDALLSAGMFNAAGIPHNHAIRRDLDGLCTPEGPLLKHPRRTIYYLHPRFARACGIVREPVLA